MGLNVSYLQIVASFSPFNYSMQKMESGATGFFIGSEHQMFVSESIPWCSTVAEIETKAFVIRKDASDEYDGAGQFYLFQNTNGTEICSCDFAEPTIENAKRYMLAQDRVYNLEIHAAYDSDGTDFLVVSDILPPVNPD
jgi:hypothetical protein